MSGLFDRFCFLCLRLTYCRKHGHRYSAFGGEVDEFCMTCGKDRRPTAEPTNPDPQPTTEDA